jgi:hypothetical protein
MRHLFNIIFLLGFVPFISAQGLVINGGADTLTSCPGNMDEIEKAFPWYSPSLNSPDLFNSCHLGVGNVPYTGFAYQNAKNGTGYLGGVWYPLNRDYICGKLSSPLVQGKTYCLSFYLNLSDQQAMVIDRIGVYLAADSIFYYTLFALPVTPQLETPEGVFFADTANWMPISFEYLAQGGERFFTIGNFRDDSTTNHYDLDTAAIYSYGYYFIDDVSLVECKGSAVEENPALKAVNVYPNPASSSFNIQYNFTHVNAVFELYGIDGKKLDAVNLQGQLGNYSYQNINLMPGVYLYRVSNTNGVISTGKLVIIN